MGLFTELLTKNNEIKIQAEAFYQILESIPVSVVITDPSLPDNPIVYCNKIFNILTGYSKEEVIGRNCRFLQGPGTTDESIDAIRLAIKNVEPIKQIVVNYTKSGLKFNNELIIVPVNIDGKNIQFIAVQNDINRQTYKE